VILINLNLYLFYRDSQQRLTVLKNLIAHKHQTSHIQSIQKKMHGKNQYGIREHTKELLRNKSKKIIC
jgi:hypothetical protein